MALAEAGRGGEGARKERVLERLERTPFTPPWWLRGAHRQTMWSPLWRRRRRLPWQLHRLATGDGDSLRLHRLGAGEVERRAVLLLHGLEGNVRSNYIEGLAGSLRQGLDLDVYALEFRSCGGELNRCLRFYHSGETSDLAFVVQQLLSSGVEQLYLAGVSLGGNVIAKWLGEEGDSVPPQLRAAAVISPPFDLTVSGPTLDAALGGFYTWRFLRQLKPKALAKAKQFPGRLDVDAIRSARNFAVFDTVVTAAIHGFRDAEDYWQQSGCGQFLATIRRPTLLVAAADDPFNPGSTLPLDAVRASPWLYPQFTPRGGHVGFVYGTPLRMRHWAEEQVTRFFQFLEEEQGRD